MKLDYSIIQKIREKRELKLLLALQLNVSESTINRHLRLNNNNNLLTTKAAIDIIKKQLNVKEKEVLTKSTNANDNS